MTDAQTPAEPLPPSPPPVRLPLAQRMHPLLFAAVALGIFFFLYQVVGGGITLLLTHGKVDEENVTLIRVATFLGEVLFLLVPAIVLGKLRYGRLSIPFPLRLPGGRQSILVFVGVFSLQQVLQAYLLLQDAIPLPPVVKHLVDVVKSTYEEAYRLLASAQSPWEFLIVILGIAVIPAVAEEFVFRGVVQRSMREGIGGLPAALAVGVIFGFYHMNPISLVPLVILGAYLGYLVYVSDNLALSISAHFFNNFLACVAAYLGVGDDVLVFAPAGHASLPILSINTAFFLVVFLAATYYFREYSKSSVPEGTE